MVLVPSEECSLHMLVVVNVSYIVLTTLAGPGKPILCQIEMYQSGFISDTSIIIATHYTTYLYWDLTNIQYDKALYFKGGHNYHGRFTQVLT